MGRGGDEDEMLTGFSRDARDQLMALLSPTTAPACVSAGMRFVHNYQFGAGAQKLVAASIRLDEVRRDDHIRVALENRLSQAATALQPGSRARQHQLGVEVEFVLEFGLPLFRQL